VSTSSGLGIEHTLVDKENSVVEGTTTQVEDEDVHLGLRLLSYTVRDGGTSRLVDDTGHVEVGGDGNHRVLGFVSQTKLGSLSHFGSLEEISSAGNFFSLPV